MEEWSRTLVEFVIARRPTACELESSCRRLIDEGKPFSPEMPEILTALKAEMKLWKPRKQALREVEELYHRILDLIPKAKAALQMRRLMKPKRRPVSERAMKNA
jgi:hypothetical protein